MLDFINWVNDHALEFWTVVASVVTIASVIVRFTPTKRDDSVFGIVMKILDALSLNPAKRLEEERKKQALKEELNERNNDTSRRALTDALK